LGDVAVKRAGERHLMPLATKPEDAANTKLASFSGGLCVFGDAEGRLNALLTNGLARNHGFVAGFGFRPVLGMSVVFR